jgi:hypothetical protein
MLLQESWSHCVAEPGYYVEQRLELRKFNTIISSIVLDQALFLVTFLNFFRSWYLLSLWRTQKTSKSFPFSF